MHSGGKQVGNAIKMTSQFVAKHLLAGACDYAIRRLFERVIALGKNELVAAEVQA